jgi:hypothetical protein
MVAYIFNSKINKQAIEARRNQAPSEFMFDERPKFDDALGKVASDIRTEQRLLAVAELLNNFRSNIPPF